MTNNFLVLGTLAAFGWVLVSGAPSAIKPATQSPASRVAATASSTTLFNTAGGSPILEARQAPVPLVRNFRPPPVPAPAPAVSADAAPVPVEQQPAQGDLDSNAAKVAAETDGYKRVSIVGKAGNGGWRAKGYRGTTEVLLTVDGTGRVSMD
jgi:hypothetical protein